jgi:histidinol-phosphate phosphatase family protein
VTAVCDIVVPTAGRPSLWRLLAALGSDPGRCWERVLVVDDRRDAAAPLHLPAWATVVRGPARGPAAARNAGWRAARAGWVAFLDDDVVPAPGWGVALEADLAAAGPGVGAVQGRVRVPLPAGRRPTDHERMVQGLERAPWITADMAYRRVALAGVGGFDERFPRPYREDADLAVRVRAAGWAIEAGRRTVAHPAGAAPARASVRRQAGNADDVLMRALHGPRWRALAAAPPGRRPRHLLVTAAGAGALGALAARRRVVAGMLGSAWLAGTAEFAWARIAPGPRTLREIAGMAWTSAVIPPVAVGWWLWGHASSRRRLRCAPRAALPAAVLLDRDGTLVHDVPYNGDPDRVAPVAGAAAALDRLRTAGVPTAIVSNQSGIARGLLSEADVHAVFARMEALLGPLGPWTWCPHGPEDGCACRKPAPGLVLEAARRLGVDPAACVVIGDIGADVEAARAAGARGILVPTPRTLPAEIAAAPEVAGDLEAAVELALAGRAPVPAGARP